VLIALFIALFIGLWCPFCRRAIALVSSRGSVGPADFRPADSHRFGRALARHDDPDPINPIAMPRAASAPIR
jgi:hypothetical protein